MIYYLQETERIEKEEGRTDIKPMKMAKPGAKGGRGGPKKAVVDTLPSPAGVRVVPKISVAVKIKGERDAAKKLFKGKVKYSVWSIRVIKFVIVLQQF